MEIYWQQIKTFLKKKEPSLLLILNEGAPIFKIEETEKQLGVSLPDSIKNFYRIHNGVHQSNFVGDWQILPLEKIEGIKRDITSLRVADEVLRRYNWNNRWIPFAVDTSGNIACVN
ncbi:MAG TPA: SMI1/KNR4 family protein, partial [Cytophagaceae bacterium]